MTGSQMLEGRLRLRWTQQVAARKLGVSQPYLSLLESGTRQVTDQLAEKAAELYGTLPTTLPLAENPASNPEMLVEDLAALEYPGFSHVRARQKRNPAAVLFAALRQNDLDSRVVEALPWVLLRYPALDWNWLVDRAKLNNLQNRLGYVTHLAFQLADASANHGVVEELARQRDVLENSRLAREDTLCHDSLSEAERAWVRNTRPAEAQHWNLLTDLRPEHLRYAS
ncbi:MAG TPA: helix-turn-helix transcriptional regulator [Bryobacteraceae bacterium]|nr:helix-turn-helix transcriptional regulator [Bryobacteraceae bacterium]